MATTMATVSAGLLPDIDARLAALEAERLRLREFRSVARREEAGRALLRKRLKDAIVVMRPEPTDYFRRACPQCGADVVGYSLRYGGEVLCCEGQDRHVVKSWQIVETD